MVELYHIKDLTLAKQGKEKINWTDSQMPVLRKIRERFIKEQPFKGKRISCCLHVTAKTACLVITLKAGGAEVFLCASNPLSTQDDVASSLVQDFDISVFAIKGESNKIYQDHLDMVIRCNHPQIIIDDGCDLVSLLHTQYKNTYLQDVFGGCEETTTGVNRLISMTKDKSLKFPMIAINESETKHLFDNRYGTGQSTLDGFIRATNILLAGKTFVVVGYGWCGKGLALRAKGMGANVIVTEIDSIKAIEATMDGFRVMKLVDAVKEADIVITVTGNKNVVDSIHFVNAKDGCIFANSGHFDVEINIPELEKMSGKTTRVKELVDEYDIFSLNKKLYILGEGRLLNLACGEGHPAMVMDMSFANQALGAEYLIYNHQDLKNNVYKLPEDIDKEISQMKLDSMGISIDELTKEQIDYLDSWKL